MFVENCGEVYYIVVKCIILSQCYTDFRSLVSLIPITLLRILWED